MVSDFVRRQVEGIQGEGTKRLQELSIIVLLLMIPLFAEIWFGDFIEHLGPISGSFSWIQLFIAIQAITGLVFLLSIVSYFWRLRNTPQFHVLFIEPIFIERKEEQKQIDTKRFYRLFLVPVGVSIGLAFTTLSYSLIPNFDWWSPGHTFLWNFGHSLSPYYPLIVVVCSSVALYCAYCIKPERLQRSAPWLLFIPIILSIFFEFHRIFWNVVSLLRGTLHTGSVSIGYLGFRGLFVAPLIILFYLTYRINVEHRDASAIETEKHLRNVIEEGWVILPNKVRVGTPQSIFLELKTVADFRRRAHDIFHYPYKSSDYLEAELQAFGLEVDGEKQLRINETSPLPIATWNYSFIKSGIQPITLMINVVKPPDNSRDVGLRDTVFMHKHTVKVDNFRSISWAPILALIPPILAAVVQLVALLMVALSKVKPP